MKKTFLKFLPIAAAVLLATSCGKDDNSAVVDNIATPDPVQEVVKPVAKTIIITGKVNQTLSKVASEDGATLLFVGGEEFTICDEDKAECGKLTIQDDKATYKAEFNADKIKEGNFIAKLGNYPDVSDWSKVSGYATLNEALKDAYYEIPFTVTKESDDAYSIGDVEASIQCALVKALSSKDITLGHVTAGNFYIIPVGEKFNGEKASVAGKIYKVGAKDLLSDAKFSVGGGKTVSFSKGNLMYRPGFGYFFADHQWDYIGANAGNTSETEGTRDLFGWGMWLAGGSPMKSTESNGDYTWADGAKSAIGSDWSTLSDAQWSFLLGLGDGEKRLNASDKLKWMAVNGVNGLVILPDECTASFTDGWETLESAGAVFLPAAGERHGASVDDAGSYGYYWSSSAGGAEYACRVSFNSGDVGRNNYRRSYGRSVRLVSGL